MTDVLLQIYLYGYGGNKVPRRIRKALAGTQVHRAWLCGFYGRFTENGVTYGPTNPYNKSFQDVVGEYNYR